MNWNILSNESKPLFYFLHFKQNVFIVNTDDGEIMNLPSQLKDIEWDTYTNLFGWPVQGLWPPLGNSTCTSKNTNKESTPATTAKLPVPEPEPTCVCRSQDRTLLAVGFSNGEVRIYNYPCISYVGASSYRVQKLHVGPVSKCSFNSNATLLLTIGELENGIISWSLCTKK